jgi:hypothetical protein
MSKQTPLATWRRFIPALQLAGVIILLAAGCTGETATPAAREGEATMELTTPEGSKGTPTIGSGGTSNSRALSPRDRELLAEARARGDKEVIMQIATEPGRSAEVLKVIESLGGIIRAHHEDLGYISAAVPTDKVDAVAQIQFVQTVSLSEELPIPDPRP